MGNLASTFRYLKFSCKRLGKHTSLLVCYRIRNDVLGGIWQCKRNIHPKRRPVERFRASVGGYLEKNHPGRPPGCQAPNIRDGENAPLARRPFRIPHRGLRGTPPDRISEDPGQHSRQHVLSALAHAGDRAVAEQGRWPSRPSLCCGARELRGVQLLLARRGRGRVPLGAGPRRGVGPRGRCGRAEVAQPAASSICAQRGTKTRAGNPGRPQVSGPGHGRAAGTRVTRRPRRARGGAERGPAQPPGPRAILERAGNRSAVATSALRWGVPARPTRHFQFRVLGNFPGCSGRVSRNQAREENPHQDESFAFSAYSRERRSLSPHPALGDPICKAPRFSKESAVAGFP